MKTIDETDRKILKLLQADASIGVEELAEKINLSRNACWRRVRRMEEVGIIRGRIAVVEPEAVGLPLSVIALIRTSAHEPEWQKKFENAVKNIPEILGAHRMSGELDYVLRLRVADVKDYDRVYQRLISQVPIADISASFVMDDIKESTVLPV